MKSVKWYLKWCIVVILLILPLCIIGIITNKHSINNVSERWSKDNDSAHISVYISADQNFSITDIMLFRENLKNKLKESNVHITKKGKQSWTDCYQAKSTVTLSDGEIDTEITAYGVGSNFFLFHPATLVSGSYFSDNNLSKDLVVLDEDMAWRYFGSTDIEGMEIYINGKLHIISGVIKRDEGMFQVAAGNGKSSVYMSYDSLVKLNENVAITSYEVVMPNLTKDYAKKIVKENVEISKSKCEIVECSNRYSFEALINVIKDVGKRSMQTKDIVYPHWENVCRGVEDVCAIILGVWLIFAGLITLYVIIKMIIYIYINGKRFKEFLINIMKFVIEVFRKIYTTIFKKNVV